MYKILLILLSILLIVIGIFYGPKIIRLYNLANLYNENSIAKNFINIDKIFTVSDPIPAADEPFLFPTREFVLPETYSFDGEEKSLSDGLKHFKTDGLIILQNGDMLYENYWNNNSAISKHIAFSVTKSFVSALV
jgi:hypothetical protein